MTAAARAGLALAACALVAACESEADDPRPDNHCVSHYTDVTTAPTWTALRAEMLADDAWGPVASIRTQARGPRLAEDLGPRYDSSDRHVVRVVDLLKPNGRRAIQADVWRTSTGSWGAGVWAQCID